MGILFWSQGPVTSFWIVILGAGVATLIEGLQLARTSGKQLVLCSLTQSVEAVLQLSKLDQIFDIFSSKELAIES